MNIRMNFIIRSDNILNIWIENYIKGELYDRQYLELDEARLRSGNYDVAIMSVEVECKKSDSIMVVFQEHQDYKTFPIHINKHKRNDNACMSFIEIQNEYDEPTYAGGYTFYHPNILRIISDYAEYADIEPSEYIYC